MAAEVLLSADPVESNTILPVPFCTPPLVPDAKVAVVAVVTTGLGIDPEPPATTPEKRLAPIPEMKLFDQLVISLKFSAYRNKGCAFITTGVTLEVVKLCCVP